MPRDPITEREKADMVKTILGANPYALLILAVEEGCNCKEHSQRDRPPPCERPLLLRSAEVLLKHVTSVDESSECHSCYSWTSTGDRREMCEEHSAQQNEIYDLMLDVLNDIQNHVTERSTGKR